MIVLPLVGFVAGAALGRKLAFAITLVAAAIGFGLAAALTDEESGWADAFIWVVTAVALAATAVGIWLRRWYDRRRADRASVARSA
jgi:uncharacterized membrane protein YhaH (DUF805 family)